jgi:hypothetical protein
MYKLTTYKLRHLIQLLGLVGLLMLSACGGNQTPNPGGEKPGTGQNPPPDNEPQVEEYGFSEEQRILTMFLSEDGQPWVVTFNGSVKPYYTRLMRLESSNGKVQIAEMFDGSETIRAGNEFLPRLITSDRVYWETSSQTVVARIPLGGARAEVPLKTQVGELSPAPFSIFSLIPGPDGNIWFAGGGTDTIGKISPAGEWLASYDAKVGLAFGAPGDLIRGSDGNIWFTLTPAGQIGSITPDGTIQTIDLKDAQGNPIYPHELLEGPDGNFYFLTGASSAGESCQPRTIGKVTRAGQVTLFEAPPEGLFSTCKGLAQLVLGADNAIWFRDISRTSIGRMTTDGSFSEVLLPEISATNLTPKPISTSDAEWKPLAFRLLVEPDGRLWVLDIVGNRVLVLKPQ